MARTDQKIEPNRYQVVPRTLCFVTHGDEVLLLRGAADKATWPNRYNGVGGHVEPHEDVFSAALREIREETGLDVQDLQLRGLINIPVDAATNTGILVFVFSAVATTRDVRASDEGTLAWISTQQLPVLGREMVEDLPTLLPRVLEAAPGGPPFSAHYSYDAQDRLVISLCG